MPNQALMGSIATEESLQPVGLSLLFVEDDDADAYLIARALADNPRVGRVVRAHDGLEALALLERGEVSVDLVLVDLHMPRMGGLELLVAIASRPALNFPTLVLTSSSAPGDAARGRLRGAVRVVTKPETVMELYAVLATAIEAVCRPGAGGTGAKPGGVRALLAADLLKSMPGHGGGGGARKRLANP
ncbi:MAG: response regulator [Caulobacter sp.]|nr:response regulator [Caulobacter sp.]